MFLCCPSKSPFLLHAQVVAGQEPLPTSKSKFKKHPNYVLESMVRLTDGAAIGTACIPDGCIGTALFCKHLLVSKRRSFPHFENFDKFTLAVNLACLIVVHQNS